MLPILKLLLNNPAIVENVLEQVIWCYGNIAGENLALRDTVIADDVVGIMASALDRAAGDSTAMRNISWCLANFMKGERPPPEQILAPCVPSLIRALQRTQNNVVITDIMWGLSFFTKNGSVESVQSIVQADGVPLLVRFMEYADV